MAHKSRRLRDGAPTDSLCLPCICAQDMTVGKRGPDACNGRQLCRLTYFEASSAVSNPSMLLPAYCMGQPVQVASIILEGLHQQRDQCWHGRKNADPDAHRPLQKWTVVEHTLGCAWGRPSPSQPGSRSASEGIRDWLALLSSPLYDHSYCVIRVDIMMAVMDPVTSMVPPTRQLL